MKEIGTHYKEVGVLPLDDTNGEVVESLVEYHHYGIIFEIFTKWIQGKGRLPVKWDTLVKVLNDVGLFELANEM